MKLISCTCQNVGRQLKKSVFHRSIHTELARVNGVVYQKLTPAWEKETTKLLADNFYSDEPMTQCLGIPLHSVRRLTEIFNKRMCENESGVVAVDEATGKLLACVNGEDFANPAPPEVDDILEAEPRWRPLLSVLEDLDAVFRKRHGISEGSQPESGRFFHGWMGAVAPEARRTHVSRIMGDVFFSNAAREGFEVAFGEATGKYSIANMATLGFQVHYHINYKTYCFEGKYPFVGIRAPHERCCLVEKKL